MERSSVEHWAERSEANAAELELLRTLWDHADQPALEVDMEAAWARCTIGPEERGRVIPISRPRSFDGLPQRLLLGVFVGVRFLDDTPP